MITKEQLDDARLELSVKSKNGMGFTFAAGIVWLVISFIWALDKSSYDKSVFTFIAGGLMLPLALLFTKLFKATWQVEGNSLQPLGLQFNFAQLFYFPFLVFALIQSPNYFVMTYAIITGAHFFPYAWFYKTSFYAVFAGVISVGALTLGLTMPAERMYLLPLFTSISLIVLTIALYFDVKHKLRSA